MTDTLRPSGIASQSSTYHIRLPVALFSLGALSALLFLVRFQGFLLNIPFSVLCTMVSLYAITVLVLVSIISPEGFWSPASAYLALLSVFHFGIVFVYGFGLLSGESSSVFQRWFFRAPAPEAVTLSALGITACALGVSLASIVTHHGYNKRQAYRDGVVSGSQGVQLDRPFALVGGALVLLSVALWFAIVLSSGGPRLLLATYSQYLDATAGRPVAYVWLMLGIGLCFLAGSRRESAPMMRTLAYSAFLVFALFALPLGLRGEVLFTSFAALVIRAKRGRRPSLKQTVIMVVVVLFTISAIKEVRQVGLESGVPVTASGNVLDALTELGSSLRPVVETVRWHDQGDDFIMGASYTAPFERPLCTLLALGECIPAENDIRLMNVLVMERVGAIGFSPIAEAYRNFGDAGVVIVMLLIGTIVGILNRLPVRPTLNALTGVILVGLMINVRNAFTALPFQLAFGICCVLAALILARFMGQETTDRFQRVPR